MSELDPRGGLLPSFRDDALHPPRYFATCGNGSELALELFGRCQAGLVEQLKRCNSSVTLEYNIKVALRHNYDQFGRVKPSLDDASSQSK
ncbi:hypothetical protein GCM10010365_03110 [Streptomyces poonensis]|uniref:Uncharacterized protein n=1 Tax=Streptomyces poonensis TaxID=68255 RepID=A0A918P7T0_9ACTN|nr:hypothetical protein GCM10010365_03110 [Streptomyces poonensis]GLJ92370.1 hypothetical protein GCM10017589_49790 [Streptomyces poonensis]